MTSKTRFIKIIGVTISIIASVSFPLIFAATSTSLSNQPLLNIAVELNRSEINTINDLSTNVVFLDHGAVSTSVNITFDILNTSGTVVHSEQNYINFDTSKVFDKKFSAVALAPGEYTLRLRALYSSGTIESLNYHFKVLPKTGGMDWLSSFSWVLGIFIILIIGVFFAWKKSYVIGRIEEDIKKRFSEKESTGSSIHTD